MTSGQYIVNRSTRKLCRNASIISVDRILRPCHLQAKCGKEINLHWSSENVMEMANTFDVNLYIDLDTFATLAK